MYVFIDIVMEGFFSHFSVKLTSAFKTAKLNALSMHAMCVCVCVCRGVRDTLQRLANSFVQGNADQRRVLLPYK